MGLVPPENILVVVRLLQEDLAELQQSAETGDEEQALKLYAHELAALVQADQDARIARSLAAATATDSAALDFLTRDEARATRDHVFALRVSQTDADDDDELYDDDDPAAAPPSRTASPAREKIAFKPLAEVQPTASTSQVLVDCTIDCTICGDAVLSTALIHVPCPDRHPYCPECLRSLFLAAAKDESLYPPRCDGASIPFELVRPHLTAAETAEYDRKAREFATLNRLYCASTCSAFLGAASAARTAVHCTACGASTCAACKAPWHGPFGVCGASDDDEAARALEREYHFKRCPNCMRVIELETGCYHIYCRCAHEFCYLCGAEWKKCDCPLWDERRLYRAVHAQNEGRARLVGIPVVPDIVPAFRDVLRDPHDPARCEHPNTVRIGGAADCDECGQHLHRFILNCAECARNICVRCRRNRVRGG
ncbi:hypothetical protein JCM3770_001218 [Rhodotorula araucariae]